METLPALQPTEKPSLEAVRSRFETWRRGKKPQSRIPKCLWQAAVEACREHPVHEVARELRLNYSELKRRSSASAGRLSILDSPLPAGFVELSLGARAQAVSCTLELESAARGKLKLTFCGVLDALELARAFWGEGR